MYYVYVLRCSDNSLYTGITSDFKKRFETHANKENAAAKYTKSHNVTGVEAIWTCTQKGDALRLEARIKKLKKIKKEELIKNPCTVNQLGLQCEYEICKKSL